MTYENNIAKVAGGILFASGGIHFRHSVMEGVYSSYTDYRNIKNVNY